MGPRSVRRRSVERVSTRDLEVRIADGAMSRVAVAAAGSYDGQASRRAASPDAAGPFVHLELSGPVDRVAFTTSGSPTGGSERVLVWHRRRRVLRHPQVRHDDTAR
jgi:hypothetical protein